MRSLRSEISSNSDEEASGPLLPTKESRKTCCPKCCQKLCCKCCIRTCTKTFFWFSTSLCMLILVGLGVGAYFLLKRDIFNPHPIIHPSKAPDPPNSPNITYRGITTIGLKWNQPNYHREVITLYEVEYNSSAGILYIVPTDRSREVNISDLNMSTRYTFRVRATNKIGTGNFSNYSNALTLNGSVPTPPGLPLVASTGTTRLNFTWEASKKKGFAISSYEVQMKEIILGGLANTTWIVVCNHNQQFCFVQNLSLSTTYYVRVRANCSIGWGHWSEIVQHHTDSNNATRPTPYDPSVQIANDASIEIFWVQENDNGAEIIHYIIQRDNGPSTRLPFAKFIHRNNPLVKKQEFRFEDLQPNRTYSIRIQACNSKGCGNWSRILNATTEVLQPLSPPKPPYVISVTPGSISLEWKNESVIAYQLMMDDWWRDKSFTSVYTGINLSYVAKDLLPASVYHFKLRVRNKAGWSNLSKSVGDMFPTNEDGNCGNKADMKIFYETKDTMKPQIQGCIIGCIGRTLQCVTDCIHKNVGMSTPCAACWAAEGQCTLDKCKIPCLNPWSAACAQCSKDKCFPACVACSGVPMWAYPP